MRSKWTRVVAALAVAALVGLSVVTMAQNQDQIAGEPPAERLERAAERATLAQQGAAATLDPNVCPTHELIVSSAEPDAEVVIRTEEGTLIRLSTQEVAGAVAALQAQEESARHLGAEAQNGVVNATRLYTFLQVACADAGAEPLGGEEVPAAPAPARNDDPFGDSLLQMPADEFMGGGGV